jgi:hypothetical protein
MKPVSASTPSESSARKPCSPTSEPDSDSDSITPAVEDHDERAGAERDLGEERAISSR